MKILFISPDSPRYSIGGIERYVDNLLHFAKKDSRNDYHFLFLVGEDSVEKHENVQVVHKNFSTRQLQSSEVSTKTGRRSNLESAASNFYTYIVQYLTEHDIDIVCTENFFISRPAGFNLKLHLAAMSLDIPIVVNIHSYPSTELSLALLNDLPWKKVLCVSKSVAGDCFAKGVDAEVLQVNSLGVRLDEFKGIRDKSFVLSNTPFNKEDFIILHASRITNSRNDLLDEKGVLSLIEAFSRLSSQNPNLKLLIATATPPASLQDKFDLALHKLEGFLKVYGVDTKAVCKVFSLDDMPKVYQGVDLFTLASHSETFGQVLVEAMATGVPVIGSNVGGILEVISHMKNGLLVKVKDAASLESAINQVLNDTALRTSLAAEASKTVSEKFDASRQFEKLISILYEVKQNQHESSQYSSPGIQ